MKCNRLAGLFMATAFLIGICSCSKNDQPVMPVEPIPITPGSVLTNIVYGSNVNWLGQNQQLGLDIYEPPQTPVTHRPLLLYVHGGGFQTGDKTLGKSFIELMQAKGFVVCSIDYRLGWTHSETNLCEGDTTEEIEAFYRAMQDTRAALRFLVANSEKYMIDTSWIFVSGESAGAIDVLGVSYITQQIADQYYPVAVSKLGLLDTDNTLSNGYNIRGIVSEWGGLSSLAVITASNAKPTIFFHGEQDAIVPFNSGHFYSCDNFPLEFGTRPMYDQLVSYHVPAVAHVDPNGGHGVFTADFRADNSACFLNALMNDAPESGYFVGDQSSCK